MRRVLLISGPRSRQRTSLCCREQLDVEKRLNLALVLLKKELELAKLQATIAKNVEEKITGDQHRFFLMEQLKKPHRKQCPEHVLQVIDEELKLQGLESSSSERGTTLTGQGEFRCAPGPDHSGRGPLRPVGR